MAKGFEEIEAGDERARAYANGAGLAAPAIALFHAWWGLNDDVIAFADRLADAGFSVLAPDLVRGRVATTIPEAESLAAGVDEKHANAVSLSAIDRLAGSSRGGKVGTVGFSLGAPWALWSASERPAVVASVVYYGSTQGPSFSGTTAPVLGHFADADPYEPEENLTGMERMLREAGRSVVLHRYADTGHWFAEPSRDAWRPEAADLAFSRTVAFLREHLTKG